MLHRVLWLAAAGIFACIPEQTGAVTLDVWLSQATVNCTQTPDYSSDNLKCNNSEPVEINLKTENDIQGSIPASISTLSSLTRLDFANTEVNGTIPSELGSLTKLEWLAFFYNTPNWGKMTGTIPEALTLLTSMTVLKIFGYWNITGTVPAGLGAMVNLQYLSLAYTGLSGSVPETFSSLEALTLFRLQYGNFEGNFPEAVSAMLKLNYLNLSDNGKREGGITGTIPDSISRLVNLNILILDYNLLYGTLPQGLWALTSLQQLSLSNNQLTGLVPNVSLANLNLKNNYFTSTPSQSVNCSLVILDGNCFGDSGQMLLDDRYINFPCQYPSKTQNECQQYCGLQPGGSTKPCGGNGTCVPGAAFFTCANCTNGTLPSFWVTDAPNQTCSIPPLFPPPPPGGVLQNPPPSPPQSQTGLIVGAVVGGLAGLAALAAVGYWVWRCRQREGLERKDRDSEEEEGGEIWARKFTLAELSAATGGFDGKNVLGSGSFGEVFKGVLQDSGKVVAVKQQVLKGKGWEQYAANMRRTFVTEARVLSRAKHANLVSLEGYCQTRGQFLLVFEFVQHGSLRDVISDAALLTWQKRIHLALGAARGLNYLHNEASPPILHLDVKSDNILVDERFNAKVADFGLAKMFQPTTGAESTLKTRTIRGTPGYMDPYFNVEVQLNKKSDVYSFGVVLLELATGWPPVAEGEKRILTRVLQGLQQNGYEGIAVPGILNSSRAVSQSSASVTSGLASSSQGTVPTIGPRSTVHSTSVIDGVPAESLAGSLPWYATSSSDSAVSSSLGAQVQDHGPISPLPFPKEPGGKKAEAGAQPLQGGPAAGPPCSPECFRKLVLLGLWCCIYDPDKRPTMGEVLKALEGIAQGAEDLDKEAVVLEAPDAVNLNLFPQARVGSGMGNAAAPPTMSDLGLSYVEV